MIRRAVVALGLVGLILGTTARAQDLTIYYFSLSVANASVGLKDATWTGVQTTKPTAFAGCTARAENTAGGELRFRYDGTDPTSSEGELLEPLEQLAIGRAEWWTALRLIRTGSTSNTIKGHCWKQP